MPAEITPMRNVFSDAAANDRPPTALPVARPASFNRSRREKIWSIIAPDRDGDREQPWALYNHGRVLTTGEIRLAFVSAFLNVALRRVVLSPPTFKLDAACVAAQAEAFVTQARAQRLPVTHLMRDRDGAFTPPSRGS